MEAMLLQMLDDSQDEGSLAVDKSLPATAADGSETDREAAAHVAEKEPSAVPEVVVLDERVGLQQEQEPTIRSIVNSMLDSAVDSMDLPETAAQVAENEPLIREMADELLDTVLQLLKGRPPPHFFLHAYHHAAVLLMAWAWLECFGLAFQTQNSG